ncbi:MAG TPA: type II secretion system F family protein [Acidimicrobiales bacterium]|jgi:tight adherence protein C
MTRALVLPTLALWAGVTLLLSERRTFARRPIVERLRPYAPNPWRRQARAGLLSVDSFRDVVAPLSQALGAWLARAFGVHEDLARRLDRIQAPTPVAGFRLRQLGWAIGAFGAAGLVVTAAGAPIALGTAVTLAAPVLAFLVLEQQVASASARWQRRVFLELPVVSEQIGMLLSAGYSLGAALSRVAERSAGSCARDLERVQARVRQGLSQVDALREWAVRVDVEAVDRLVSVLALNREAGDLGRMIAEEARTTRRDVQRQLVEQIQRRSQQVWIPVTVATLVPGTLFLAVPFLQAMRLFAGS